MLIEVCVLDVVWILWLHFLGAQPDWKSKALCLEERRPHGLPGRAASAGSLPRRRRTGPKRREGPRRRCTGLAEAGERARQVGDGTFWRDEAAGPGAGSRRGSAW